MRGSAAQRTTRRLCRTPHVYDGRAVCFCVTRQSHATSLRGNGTGADGVLEIYAGDKLTTASATSGDGNHPYRFGYGVLD